MDSADSLVIGFAQIAPVWLDREPTLAKVVEWANRAGADGCRLLAFGEALVPGYPFWIELTDGARFNSPVQKAIHAHYAQQAVQIEAGHLDALRRTAARHHMGVYLGCVERPPDRGGHSLYASLVYIDPEGVIGSVHRKLMPTYEERLAWSPGDGHGLRVHALGAFSVGGLNCWENWMPLPRAALYGQGENLHVAIWPGGIHNTQDITRFIAREARSYVLSASGLLRRQDVPARHARGRGDPRHVPGRPLQRRLVPRGARRPVGDRADGRAGGPLHGRDPPSAGAGGAPELRPRRALLTPRRDPAHGEPDPPEHAPAGGLASRRGPRVSRR